MCVCVCVLKKIKVDVIIRKIFLCETNAALFLSDNKKMAEGK